MAAVAPVTEFQIRTEVREVTGSPGETVRIPLTITRVPGYNDAFTLNAVQCKFNLTSTPAQFRSVVPVPAGATSIDFTLPLPKELPPGDYSFAICRGIQVLNVARGGTLVQDIPSEVPGALEHKLTVPPNEPFTLAHEVWVEDGSVLAQLIGEAGSSESPQVNSRHHQAVKKLGEGLVAVATAPDGVIEAVEDPTRRFCVGVQWHPENFYRTGEFRALFEGFIKACRI